MLVGKIFLSLKISLNYKVYIYSCKTKRSEGSDEHRRYYNAQIPYVDYKKVCLEKEHSHEVLLDAIEYVFPFEFELPDELPTSFEHYNGHIRYWIQGVIHIPWAINRYTHSTFTVINTLNLNTIADVQMPRSVTDSKEYFTLLNSKPVEIQFDVNKSKTFKYLRYF